MIPLPGGNSGSNLVSLFDLMVKNRTVGLGRSAG